MEMPLRFNIADERLSYSGQQQEFPFDPDRILEFNHRHKAVLSNYDISLQSCSIVTLADQINHKSNLGALRNRQVRQAVILAAALPAVAVALRGRGSLARLPKDQQT
ncbi:MAG TPA: hypothetical protein VN285_07765, partial [Candidatus Deferrimicrobium sp.]|nr:hypothetical protein [Candidatus Deferrimicrobium sp.]